MKPIKLTQKQLRSLIKEAAEDSPEALARATGHQDVDGESAQAAVDAFIEMLTSGESIDSLVETMVGMMEDEAFYPGRIEDIEPMAASVAKRAAALLANDPGFFNFMSEALARTFRRALR